MSDAVHGGVFVVEVPLLKAWQEPTGELRFEGVASSTALDRQRERMSRQAIEKMTRFGGLDLLPSHGAGLLEELGTVEECCADNERLVVRGLLEGGNPKARQLYARCCAGKKFGLSVGGKVLDAHWEFDAATGQSVRVIDDVHLDHVAICHPSQAINPDTYLGVMAKASEACAEPMRSGVSARGESGEDDGTKGGDPASELRSGAWEGRCGKAAVGTEAGCGLERPAGYKPPPYNATRGRLWKAVRQIALLSRSLWGDGGDTAEATEVGQGLVGCDAVTESLRELRDQLGRAVADLSAVAQALTGRAADCGEGDGVRLSFAQPRGEGDAVGAAAMSREAQTVAKAGQGKAGLVACPTERCSLDGQERSAGQRAQLWKGVL